MNLLEDRLKHASASVLLGAVKVFLNLTKNDKKLSRDVQERLSSPLITMMATDEVVMIKNNNQLGHIISNQIYILNI